MYQLFCNVDENGNIIESYIGQNIIATYPYHHFFYVDQAIFDNLYNYKVEINGYIPTLVLK